MKYLILLYLIAFTITSKSNPNYSNAKEIYNFLNQEDGQQMPYAECLVICIWNQMD